MNRVGIVLAGALSAICACAPASAWMHANRWGGDTFHAFGSDSTTRTDGWGGSMTHTWGEGTTATNRWGDTATHQYGSGQTTFANPWGGSATHTYGEGTNWNTAYGGSYHTEPYDGGAYYRPYYPPATVGYYGAGCPACGWGAAAAGAAVGAAAGAAIASAGTYATLPSGCYSPGGGGLVYNCGGFWVKPVYGANGLYYRTVPAP